MTTGGQIPIEKHYRSFFSKTNVISDWIYKKALSIQCTFASEYRLIGITHID